MDRERWETIAASYRTALGRFTARPGGILPRHWVRDAAGWQPGPPCPLNTAGALVALHALELAGEVPPLDPEPLWEALVGSHLERMEWGGLALALWAAAVGRRERVQGLCMAAGERWPRSPGTLHAAWMLVALCQCAAHGVGLSGLEDRIRELEDLLLSRQTRAGLFRASARREGLLRRPRRDATLSTQTYAVLALACAGSLRGDRLLLDAATRCAEALCALQGEGGEWWRRYRVDLGEVLERYPVYCVNQTGGVPMALGALQRVRGTGRYAGAIAKGVEWVFGGNPLGLAMISPGDGVLCEGLKAEAEGLEPIRGVVHLYHPVRGLLASCVLLGHGGMNAVVPA